jgi:hypothetical protein
MLSMKKIFKVSKFYGRVNMATYAEVIYCKNCKFCDIYYHGEHSKIGMFSYTCTKELKEVQPFNFCSWAKYKEEKNETD